MLPRAGLYAPKGSTELINTNKNTHSMDTEITDRETKTELGKIDFQGITDSKIKEMASSYLAFKIDELRDSLEKVRSDKLEAIRKLDMLSVRELDLPERIMLLHIEKKAEPKQRGGMAV